MANKAVGTITCVNRRCRSPKARLSISKSGLAVITCNKCHCQTFARGDTSDEDFRSEMVPLAEPAAPAPAGDDKPEPTPVPTPVPAGDDKPQPTPKPARPKNAFDIY